MTGVFVVACLAFAGWWWGIRDADPKKGGAASSAGSKPSVVGSTASNKRSDEQPFLTSEVRMLAKAETAFAAGSTFRAESVANGVRSRVPQGSPAHLWLEMQQAARLYVQGEPDLAKPNLERVARATAKGPASPVALVSVLRGTTNFKAFQQKQKDAPDWYLDLASYYAGLRLVATGKRPDAGPLLKRYAARKNGQPEWAFLAQATAQNLLGGAQQGNPTPGVTQPTRAPEPIQLSPGETVLLRTDFESGTLAGWTAQGGAGLYSWSGAPAENHATSGRFALVDDRNAKSHFTLSQPLPLASKGLSEVTISFHHRWISPSTTRRVRVQYSATGNNWIKAGEYSESEGSPVRCVLRKGVGEGFWLPSPIRPGSGWSWTIRGVNPCGSILTTSSLAGVDLL